MRRLLQISLSALILATSPALANSVPFEGWKHQKFSLLGGNDWDQRGEALAVASDGSVSLVWTPVPQSLKDASSASWTWSVDVTVPATDLTLKGGDDRNLSVYAIFAPEGSDVSSMGVKALIDNPDVRVLMYVWGGDHQRGDILPSPYLGARGKTVILRPSSTGRHEERVSFDTDLQKAFGSSSFDLVGLAVSSDSDDTDLQVRAMMSKISFSN